MRGLRAAAIWSSRSSLYLIEASESQGACGAQATAEQTVVQLLMLLHSPTGRESQDDPGRFRIGIVRLWES